MSANDNEEKLVESQLQEIKIEETSKTPTELELFEQAVIKNSKPNYYAHACMMPITENEQQKINEMISQIKTLLIDYADVGDVNHCQSKYSDWGWSPQAICRFLTQIQILEPFFRSRYLMIVDDGRNLHYFIKNSIF